MRNEPRLDGESIPHDGRSKIANLEIRDDGETIPTFEIGERNFFLGEEFPTSKFEVVQIVRVIHVPETIQLITSDL